MSDLTRQGVNVNRRGVRSKVGDVFLVPIDKERAAIGQIVDSYIAPGCYYFAFFEGSLAIGAISEDAVREVLQKPLILLGLGLDAKLWSGEWKIVATQEPVPVNFPAYKISRNYGDLTAIAVEDYTGLKTRRASPEEAETLYYRRIMSAAVVEDAVKALHGALDWNHADDDLLPEVFVTTADMFSGHEC